MKVACLGPKGSFTSGVVSQLFPNGDISYMSTYRGCQALKNQEVSFAVYPLENNLGGFVFDTLKSIYSTSKISIAKIETVKIEQNLIGNVSNIEEIKEIHSHPQAIAQCQNAIRNIESKIGREIKIVKVGSTSEAIIEASKEKDIVAIGSKEGAKLYGVPIIKESFQDKSINETRFAVFKIGSPTQNLDNYKTMFLIEIDSLTEGLSQIINLVDSLSIDISSLSHYPISNKKSLWRYAFFLEVEGNILSKPIKILHKVLTKKKLYSQSRKARLIGSYYCH